MKIEYNERYEGIGDGPETYFDFASRWTCVSKICAFEDCVGWHLMLRCNHDASRAVLISPVLGIFTGGGLSFSVTDDGFTMFGTVGQTLGLCIGKGRIAKIMTAWNVYVPRITPKPRIV